MDYEALLELVMDVAYEIQCCGAETYRVEDCVFRILHAYGVNGEVFAIPNTLIVSIETPDGRHMNRMRRNLHGSTNIAGVEAFNGLSRTLCQTTPPVEEGRALLEKTKREVKVYGPVLYLLGHFLAGAGFGIFFGGALIDFLLAGLSGVVAGISNLVLDRFQANVFFKTAISAFFLSFTAHILFLLGLGDCLDAAITGALMLLVPGLLFTNSMRDLIYGDSMSGVNRLMQVVIITVALAVGIGAGGALSDALWTPAISPSAYQNGFVLECAGAIVAGFGFCMVFNAHGVGIVFCLLGNIVSWGTYYICAGLGMTEVVGFLVASAAAATYAETMARIRRCPSTPFLVFALLPLIPGSSLYYTMAYALQGDMDAFLYRGTYTAALAGALAVGVLFAATCFRMWSMERMRKLKISRHFH